MDPDSDGGGWTGEVITETQYRESLNFLLDEDAIMDENSIEHGRCVSAYLYRQGCKANEGDAIGEAYNPELAMDSNREVLRTLTTGYVGYAWLCQIAADWLSKLRWESASLVPHRADRVGDVVPDNFEQPQESMDWPLGFVRSENAREGDMEHSKAPDADGASTVIIEGLADMIKSTYNTDTMRAVLLKTQSAGSWRPPGYYWYLMKHPTMAAAMQALYEEKPQDEFLACWYEDMTMRASSRELQGDPQGTPRGQTLSVQKLAVRNLTSNFSVFSLRVGEEIRRYLLTNPVVELGQSNPGDICDLFCRAENAFFYGQAILSFITAWRRDLCGCRRLSQLLQRRLLTTPQVEEANGEEGRTQSEKSTAHLCLIFHNLGNFPGLYQHYRSAINACSGDRIQRLHPAETAALCDSLMQVLRRFEKGDGLLYQVHRDAAHPRKRQRTALHDGCSDISTPETSGECFNMASASQVGAESPHEDAYLRQPIGPELPPLSTFRSCFLIDALLLDIIGWSATRRVDANDNATFPAMCMKSIELLVLLCVISPYELLVESVPERNEQRTQRGSRRALREGQYRGENGDSSGNSWSSTSLDDSFGSTDLSQSRLGSGMEENHDPSAGIAPSSDGIPQPHSSAIAGDNSAVTPIVAASTISSNIFFNRHQKTHLRRQVEPKVNPDVAKFREMADRFRRIARKELYQIYRILRDPLLSMDVKLLRLLGTCSTTIAASAALIYIRTTLFGELNSDSSRAPINLVHPLTHSMVAVLRQIADCHMKKRGPILVLLKQIYMAIGTEKTLESDRRHVTIPCSGESMPVGDGSADAGYREIVIRFLVYLMRFEGMSIAVLENVYQMLPQMDRRHIRVFLQRVCEFCRPSYAAEFSINTLKIIKRYNVLVGATSRCTAPPSNDSIFAATIAAFIYSAAESYVPSCHSREVIDTAMWTACSQLNELLGEVRKTSALEDSGNPVLYYQ